MKGERIEAIMDRGYGQGSGKLRLATTVATCLSVVALSVCVVMVPLILYECQAVWASFQADMDTFRVLSGDLWTDILSMSTPASRRVRRQYGIDLAGAGYPPPVPNGGIPIVPGLPGGGESPPPIHNDNYGPVPFPPAPDASYPQPPASGCIFFSHI